MTLDWKIVIDCAEPQAQAAFWAAALGYAVEDNRVLIERLLSAGAIGQDAVVTVNGRPAFRTLQAVRHPDDPVQEGTGTGLGRRLLFQQVPEPKTAKNRLHLDLHAGPDHRDAEVARLRGGSSAPPSSGRSRNRAPNTSSWPTPKAMSSASSDDVVLSRRTAAPGPRGSVR